MVTVQLPEFDVDDVEVLITKEVTVFIDICLIFNIHYDLSDLSSSILPVCNLTIELLIGSVHNTVYDTQ
jgi:hypothetical protein